MMQLPEKYLYAGKRRYSLKLGNLKISGNTVISNLPPMKTCPGKGDCVNYCYSWKKLHGHFPTVRKARATNHKHSLRASFVDDMTTILRRLISKYTYIKAVRLHEAGDFYDGTYLKKWIEIIKQFPETTFYTYTKSVFVQKHDLPENLVIWYSHGGKDDHKYKKENNQAIVIHPGETTPKGFYVCPTIGHPEKVCGKDCSYCMKKGKGRRIAFPLH